MKAQIEDAKSAMAAFNVCNEETIAILREYFEHHAHTEEEKNHILEELGECYKQRGQVELWLKLIEEETTNQR